MSGHETEQMSLMKSAREPGSIRPSAAPLCPVLLSSGAPRSSGETAGRTCAYHRWALQSCPFQNLLLVRFDTRARTDLR